MLVVTRARQNAAGAESFVARRLRRTDCELRCRGAAHSTGEAASGPPVVGHAARAADASSDWVAGVSRLDLKTSFTELLPESKPSVIEMRRTEGRLASNATLTVVAEVAACRL